MLVAGARRRIAYIDGLRAVAVLGVVACHAGVYSGADPSLFLTHILTFGARGVELFFVLSGFCLAYPTLRRLKETGTATFNVSDYSAKRLVRIIPPFWTTIALVVGAALVLQYFRLPLPGAMHAAALTPGQIIGQAFFSYADRPHILTDPFWTLPIEFRWYFLFPICLWLWARFPRSYATITIIGVAFYAMTGRPPFDLYLPGFALGIIAADLRIRNLRLGLVGFVGLLTSIWLAILTSPATWHQDWNPFWILAAFFFVVVCGELDWLETLLSLRLIVLVGIASYSIYLIHAPVISFAIQLGVSPLLAASYGIVAGLVFWYVAERVFTDSPVRNYLLAVLRNPIRKAFAFAGIGDLTLQRPQTEPQRVRSMEKNCQYETNASEIPPLPS